MVRRASNKESPPKIPKRSTVNSSRPVLNECLITTLRLCVSRENKCKIMLKRHSCVCRFAFLMVLHCVNLVKGVNDAFPAPISRDYRRGHIKGHMAEFILCWCNNSPPREQKKFHITMGFTLRMRSTVSSLFHQTTGCWGLKVPAQRKIVRWLRISTQIVRL